MPNNESITVQNGTISFNAGDSSKYIANERENIKTDLIKITKDKLENILLKFLDNLKLRISWATPFSIFISTLTTLLTAEFKDFFIGKDIWHAIFLICTLLSGIWLIVNIIRLITSWKKSSIDFLINKISNVEKEEKA